MGHPGGIDEAQNKCGGALGEHVVAELLTTCLAFDTVEYRIFCTGDVRLCVGDALVAANYYFDYRLWDE